MNEREFLVFLSFFLFSFLIILLSFPPFSISSLSLVYSSPNQDVSFIAPSFIKSSFLSSSGYYFLSYFLVVLSHSIPSIICLRKMYSFIHLKYRPDVHGIVVFSISPLLFCVFHFSKLLSRFYFFIPFF